MDSEINPWKKQEKLNIATGSADYVSSFDNAALTPTIVGELGSKVASSASAALAQKRGLEAGLNPSGDALPPITSADKAYVDAYQNQSQSTLANQATSLFFQADEQMSKLNNVGSGDIAQYNKTVKEGLDDILKLAPNDVKFNLFNQFNQKLISQNHQMTTRMISQQKEEQKQNALMAIVQQNESIHGAVMSGNFESGKAQLDAALSQIDKGYKGGVFSLSSSEAQKKTARLNYYSSALTKNGLDSLDDGKEAEWRNNLATQQTPPDGMSYSEWDTVRGNANTYISKMDSYRKQETQLTSSDGMLDIAEKRMTPEMMQDYHERLKTDPTAYNNLAIAYANQLHKKESKESAESRIISTWSKKDGLIGERPSDINNAFKRLTQMTMQQSQARGNPISEEDAEFRTAIATEHPVPYYNDKIIEHMNSGNGETMMQAVETYQKLSSYGGNRAIQFENNTEAHAMMANFETALNQTPNDAQTAAQKAYDIVHKRGVDVTEVNNQLTAEYFKSKGETTGEQLTQARKLADTGKLPSDQPTALLNQFKKSMTQNMQWTGGDTKAAERMTKAGFKVNWGSSKINGDEMFMMYPPDKMLFGDGAEKSVPIFQNDLYNSIKEQIQVQNKSYDSGAAQFYYEMVERPTMEQLYQAKEFLKKNPGKGSDSQVEIDKYYNAKKIINDFDSLGPPKIRKVYPFEDGKRGNKDKVEEFTAVLRGSPYQSVSVGSGTLLGSYNVLLKDSKNGGTVPFVGLFKGGAQEPHYAPNVAYIAKHYQVVNNLATPEKQLGKAKEFIKEQK